MKYTAFTIKMFLDFRHGLICQVRLALLRIKKFEHWHFQVALFTHRFPQMQMAVEQFVV